MRRPTHMSKCIMQEWTHKLPLRFQGVLVSAVRGCDTEPKDSHAKTMSRLIRGSMMNAHCGDMAQSKSFMMAWDEALWNGCSESVIRDHDSLPHHYIMHLVHAVEILGYTFPDEHRRGLFLRFYLRMCKKLHMNPECEWQLYERLTADEETHFKGQDG